jgi:integrase
LILVFDTALVKESISEPKSDSLWQKTQFSNLIRYVPSGKYYARVRIRGKLIVKSLKTDRISVAKLRLSDLEQQERKLDEQSKRVQKGRVLFGDMLSMFESRLASDTERKPRTKSYYKERTTALLKSWPGITRMDVRDFTKANCLEWSAKFSKQSSETAYNNTVAVLRQVLDLALEAGARYENPAKAIRRRSPKPKKLTLPSQDQFLRWISEMRQLGDGWCKASSWLVQFLAYGGFRKEEATNIAWGDCDFEKKIIRVYGDPETRTKNGEFRTVPMIPDMVTLLEEIKSEIQFQSSEARVMQVTSCQGNMDRALKKVPGMVRITHHDLRHLFITRCIESGIDIPTVARWAGHKDGGALIMKTYGHLRDEHSNEMAKRVSFKKPENIVELQKAEGL